MYWYILNYIDMYWCFVNFSSVNSCNSPWTMKLSSELCWSSPRGLPLAAPAYTAAIRTLGRRLCWHEALWREAPLPSFSFLFSFLLFHTISGCFCTLHSTMQDVHFGSFLICTFCIPCILPYIDWRSWLKSKKSCSQHKRTRALETNIYKYRDSHRVINSPIHSRGALWSSPFRLELQENLWTFLDLTCHGSWGAAGTGHKKHWDAGRTAEEFGRHRQQPGAIRGQRKYPGGDVQPVGTWARLGSCQTRRTHHHSSPLITTHHLSILLLS